MSANAFCNLQLCSCSTQYQPTQKTNANFVFRTMQVVKECKEFNNLRCISCSMWHFLMKFVTVIEVYILVKALQSSKSKIFIYWTFKWLLKWKISWVYLKSFCDSIYEYFLHKLCHQYRKRCWKWKIIEQLSHFPFKWKNSHKILFTYRKYEVNIRVLCIHTLPVPVAYATRDLASKVLRK